MHISRVRAFPLLPRVAGVAWIAAAFRSARRLARLWRQRRRERSELLCAPASVHEELQARGIDVEREVAKPWWLS